MRERTGRCDIAIGGAKWEGRPDRDADAHGPLPALVAGIGTTWPVPTPNARRTEPMTSERTAAGLAESQFGFRRMNVHVEFIRRHIEIQRHDGMPPRGDHVAVGDLDRVRSTGSATGRVLTISVCPTGVARVTDGEQT